MHNDSSPFEKRIYGFTQSLVGKYMLLTKIIKFENLGRIVKVGEGQRDSCCMTRGEVGQSATFLSRKGRANQYLAKVLNQQGRPSGRTGSGEAGVGKLREGMMGGRCGGWVGVCLGVLE